MGAPRGRRAVAVLLLMMTWSGLSSESEGAEASLEYAIKANFLYKFAPFVEWPAGAFPSPASALTICAQGNDRVSELLDQVTAGQRIGVRPILVKHLDIVDQNSGCHVLYAAGTARQEASAALLAIKGLPVLSVTDSARSPQAAGIINFVLQDNRVRFDIDISAAKENQLAISSRLLTLARTLRGQP